MHNGGMATLRGVEHSSFRLGPKGRAVLPAAVRRAAHIPDGATLVAHAEADGRIVLETADAIRERVWAGARPEGDGDTVAEVSELRQHDAAVADAAAERRSAAGGHDSDEVGAALLARLGL